MKAARQGGRGKCSVCAHKQLDEIDSALVSGGSLDSTAERFGLSRSSLMRHKRNHPARVLGVAPGERAEPIVIQHFPGTVIDIPAELQAQFARTLSAVEAAHRTRSHAAIDSANREHRLTLDLITSFNDAQRKLEILARPTGDVLNVLTTATWRETTVLLFKLLERFPEARIAVSLGLHAAGKMPPGDTA
jgi:hypothetical protein